MRLVRVARAAASRRGGPQLTLRSFAPSAGRCPRTFPSLCLRLFEPRSSPPPHCGGLQLADGSRMSSAVGEQPSPQAAARTTAPPRGVIFGGSR